MEIITFIWSNLNWIATTFGGGSVFVLVWRFLIKPRLIMWKKMYEQLTVISEQMPKIQEIYSEMKPNGGTSLRDAVNRIESLVNKQRLYTKTMIKSFPGGTFDANEKGELIGVNKSVCTLLNRTESELIRDNWIKWIHVDDKDRVIKEWHRCIESQSDFDMEFKIMLPDKGTKKVGMVAYQLRDEAGGLHGFIGTLTQVY